MYIQSTDNNSTRITPKAKRMKTAAGSSFAEAVETLLDLDAVDITSPHDEKNRKQQPGEDKSKAEEDKAQPSAISSAPAVNPDGKFNITA